MKFIEALFVISASLVFVIADSVDTGAWGVVPKRANATINEASMDTQAVASDENALPNIETPNAKKLTDTNLELDEADAEA
jgi:hypothetical protein